MLEYTDKHKEVLSSYARAIVHIRSQIAKERQRLGLVFGAGLSRSFGLPTWNQLVINIASDDEVDAQHIVDCNPPSESLPYMTELIFQHFRKKVLNAENGGEEDAGRDIEFEIAARWIEIIRKHLYADANGDIGVQIAQHPYLKKLIPIVKKSHMTITYNFDDYIEQAIEHLRSPEERKKSKGYEVVTTPWTQFRRSNAVIYHPNGIVPNNNMETPSDRIVFSEAGFVDKILGNYSGEDTGLLNHLSKHTCVFVGLSLDDETLRTLLSKSAKNNPGSFHYYIAFEEEAGAHPAEYYEAVQKTNFQVYNLITLFLDNEGIAAFFDMIVEDPDDFKDFATANGIQIDYRFYLTGPLGVGKSTTIGHLRNLSTYDEWLERRIPILGKPWDQLTDDERTEADTWILGQFKLKNTRLRREDPGICVIDRGPMDPLAFTLAEERNDKAKMLVEAYSPGQADYHVMPGTLLFLSGDTSELEVRLKMSSREGYTKDKLDEMEKDLLAVYGEENVRIIDTKGLTVEQVVRAISRVIHLESYAEMDMKARLQSFVDENN